MKILRNVLLFLLVSLLYAPVASAQNGAVVTKGDFLLWWGDWNGGEVLALMSSDSELFCGEDFADLIWSDWLDVLRPDSSIKVHERGAYFTRVFYPATPPEETHEAYCDLWNNGPLVAEGITHSTLNDNDRDRAHPNRRYTWGYNVAGTLEDYAGFCDDGMVELNTVVRFMLKKDRPACEPDCLIVKAKGPRLNCPN
jgi:hypothetical protein